MRRFAIALVSLAALLALCGPTHADKNLYGVWIGKLGGEEDAQMRARLLRAGTHALEALCDAVRNGPNKEAAAVLIAEIEKREPFGLRLSAGMPKMALTKAVVNGDRFRYSVRVENRSGRAVTLWPYLSLRVLDPGGNELKPRTRIGRGGLRVDRNFLAGVKFVTLEPGERWSFTERLSRYVHDADWICGWKVPGPGTYTLEFTYHFDRAAAKKRCDPEWKQLDDANEPWNKALEFKHAFTTEMRVE